MLDPTLMIAQFQLEDLYHQSARHRLAKASLRTRWSRLFNDLRAKLAPSTSTYYGKVCCQ